ncbi:hypothetical protein Patl1_31542 [Pistacia atlantica]|uniref:Uncharacterized protein n=1 Tax=Pistacia atlantica TaxID=434234 RepID=A0ACC1APU7_9ROSI|nr:hypothetical protein Patl1_31542 [Pistacia atlantica]
MDGKSQWGDQEASTSDGAVSGDITVVEEILIGGGIQVESAEALDSYLSRTLKKPSYSKPLTQLMDLCSIERHRMWQRLKRNTHLAKMITNESRLSEDISSLLAAASPNKRKDILGERLLPLVKKIKIKELAEALDSYLSPTLKKPSNSKPLTHLMRNTHLAKMITNESRLSEDISSLLAVASPNKRKDILGERLLPLVKKIKNHYFIIKDSSKIIGMLLEIDNSKLLVLLESLELLASKVEEAARVLEHNF